MSVLASALVPLGDGRRQTPQRVMRVHANFAEYVPLALFLLAPAELTGTTAPLLHTHGLALLSGRALHAYGVSQTAENYRFRVAGMALTCAASLVAALLCLLESAGLRPG
jgi:hypothetical protein